MTALSDLFDALPTADDRSELLAFLCGFLADNQEFRDAVNLYLKTRATWTVTL